MAHISIQMNSVAETSQLLLVHTLDWNAVKQRIDALTRMPSAGNRTIGNIDVTAVIVIK